MFSNSPRQMAQFGSGELGRLNESLGGGVWASGRCGGVGG